MTAHSVFPTSENYITFTQFFKQMKNLSRLFDSSLYSLSSLSQDSPSELPTNCIFSSYSCVYFHCHHSKGNHHHFLK